MFALIDAGEAITDELQIPVTPESAKRAPAYLIYWAIGNASWLFAWPMVFVVFLAPTALEGKIAHWLSVGGFALWVLSMFSFYGFLRALEEYSTVLKVFVRGLEFVFDVLTIFLMFG